MTLSLWAIPSTPPDSCPSFPILPAPDYDPRLVPLVPRSPVSCPGFPILPVPDDNPRFAPLDPRSPVSCPSFPILPVPDDDPRFAPLDPRSPVSCPGFPILPAPDHYLNKVCYKRYPLVRVLLLGPNHTRYSTIWPPNGPSAQPRSTGLDRVETHLQHQEAMLASTTANIQLAAANQEQALAMLSTQVQQLTATLAHSLSLPAPPSHPPSRSPPPAPALPGPVREAQVGVLEGYTGDPEGCSPFITNCSILFALQPYTFATEEAKVAFTINSLTGRARLWGTAKWERHTSACSSFNAFTTELCKVFGIASRGPDTSGGLLGLRQGSCSVTDYAIDFRIRARRSEWNQAAQVDAFLLGLADYIKDELVSYDLPASLDEIIALASRVDRRIQARHHESLYCGQPGHFLSKCPAKGQAHQ